MVKISPEVDVSLLLRVVYRDPEPSDHVIISELTAEWEGTVHTEPYLANDRLLLEIRAESMALMKAVRVLRKKYKFLMEDQLKWKVEIVDIKFKFRH